MIMMLSMAMRIIHSVLQMQRDFAQGVPPLDPVGLVAFVQPDNDGNSGSGSGPLPADNDEECSSTFGLAASSVEEGATAVSACDESKGSNEKEEESRLGVRTQPT
jgi:hypothetical protein